MVKLRTIRPARFRPVLTLAIVAPVVILLWAWLELWIAYSITPKLQKNYGAMVREAAESWQDTSGTNGWDHLAEAVRLHEEHVRAYYNEEEDINWVGSLEYDTIVNPDGALQVVRKVSGTEHSDAHFQIMRGWALETIGKLDSLGIQAQLDALATSDYVLRPIDDSVVGSQSQPYRSLSPFRALARCLHARMILSRDSADWETYIGSYRSISAIGHALALQPSLIDSMIASAILALGRQQVIRDLHSGALPDETILALFELSRTQPEGLQPEQLLRVERYTHMDIFQRYFGRGGRMILTEYAKLVPFAEEEHWIINVQGLWKPRWSHYEQLIEDHYDEMTRVVNLTFAECEPLRPENRSRGLIDRFIDPKEDDGPLPVFDPSKTFAERFLSEEAAFSLADQQILSATLRDGFQLMLAIEGHRIREGGYPSTLDELTPEYIGSIPTDLCSPSAQPWIYRRFDGPDELGRSFLLYAVGFDMQDNDGARPTADLTQALSRKNKGTDYVVSHPPLPESTDE